MEIIISIPIILKLVGRSNEIKHKKDLMQYKNCDVPSNLHSYLPKKTQSVGEIRHETMRGKKVSLWKDKCYLELWGRFLGTYGILDGF